MVSMSVEIYRKAQRRGFSSWLGDDEICVERGLAFPAQRGHYEGGWGDLLCCEVLFGMRDGLISRTQIALKIGILCSTHC